MTAAASRRPDAAARRGRRHQSPAGLHATAVSRHYTVTTVERGQAWAAKSS
jgi:hypothetical protein